MRRSIRAYILTALLLALALLLLADFSAGFLRLDKTIKACDAVSVLWMRDGFASSTSEQRIVYRTEEPELFAALEDRITGCRYRKSWNQSDAANGHALASASITLRFIDGQKGETACVYAAYDDGMIVMDYSVVRPGWFYAKRAQGLYVSIETLLFPEGAPIS